jgi:hypothetical protein
MARKCHYIPRKDADFDAFFTQYCQYVNEKCTGAPPAWTHVPDARRTELNGACTDWSAAYGKTKRAHTPSDTLAKNLARARDGKILGNFNNEFVRYSSAVSPREKLDLGNRERDTRRTPVPPPASLPEADIVFPGIHTVELVNIRRAPGIGSDDPRSDYGVRIHFGILDASGAEGNFRISVPPATGDDLPHSDFVRRKKYRFDFSEEDRGKTVYFCLRYENSKGGREGKGPFGPILFAIIP